MKKFLALACIFALCAGLLIYSFSDRNAPSKKPALNVSATPDEPTETRMATPDEPRQETLRFVFLNDQPVLQLIYDQLSDEFFEQTGIRVVTVSAQSNLDQQLPVLFSTAEPGSQWPCLDLSDTVACANLACNCFTWKEEDLVWGIANETEPFGLIYNAELLARVGYTGTDINSFSSLKAVAAYINNHQDSLGFGAFAPADEALFGAVPGNTDQIWNLYQSHYAPGDLLSGSAVFALGTVSDMERLSRSGQLQLDMLPLYTGVADEENQGVHCFVKSYWCVRQDASEEEIQAALAFLNFLVSPRNDGTVPVDDLALLAPYRQAIYARNSVQQRFRNDIAQGRNCTVCRM